MGEGGNERLRKLVFLSVGVCGRKQTFARAGVLEGEMANPRAFTVAHWRFLGGFCGFVFRCIYSTFQGDLAEVRVCVRKLSASGVGKFAAGAPLGEIGLDRSDHFDCKLTTKKKEALEKSGEVAY